MKRIVVGKQYKLTGFGDWREGIVVTAVDWMGTTVIVDSAHYSANIHTDRLASIRKKREVVT